MSSNCRKKESHSSKCGKAKIDENTLAGIIKAYMDSGKRPDADRNEYQSVGDCVFGRHNESYPQDVQQHQKLHRDNHQQCLETNALLSFMQKVEEKVNNRELTSGLTFDELWLKVSDLPHSGIGPVTIYDTCLRLSLWKGLPAPVYVYLHSSTGPLLGAKEYFRHKKVTSAITPTGTLPVSKFESGMRVDISNFPEFVAARLDAMNIEHLLCVCHDALKQLP